MDASKQSQIIHSKDQLDEFVTKNWDEINKYIDKKQLDLPIPFYTSVDIRESKTKYAPVDNNLYPAGFNNLCLLDLDAASEAMRQTILKQSPEAKEIGIIPESHTKNKFYLDHLSILGKAVRDAGFEVTFLGLDQNIFENNDQKTLDLVSHSGFDISFQKAELKNGKVTTGEKEMDFLILNNDQSNPLDIPWDSLSTPVVPTPKIGWFKRQKNSHFKYYQQVIDEFCSHFQISSELLGAKFKSVDNVDFLKKEGLEKLAGEIDSLLSELPKDSSIFVKASQGTYGMGISVVKSGEEIITMNRKMRNKMDVGKNQLKFSSVLIQESVETILKYDQMPAEVTIYQVDGKSIGGFMRANGEKDSNSNLNSRGMVFKKFCISEIRQNQDHKAKEAIYSVVARLSTLASAHEIKDVL